MLPFRLRPACKDYLWGGNRLIKEYGKQTDGDICAETWELSAHPDGSSVIDSGELAGMSFAEFVRTFPGTLGTNVPKGADFPILIKLIDAARDLSVQVHPGDEYARRAEQAQGKTEMWVVVDAAPGAFLYCGFDREPTREELERRIADNTLPEILGKVAVTAGDVLFIPAGTIHAIGAGILLAEIQQNSNATYRVYDYGRRDKDGSLRPLHVEKALDVIDRTARLAAPPGCLPSVSQAGYSLARLASCPYFTVQRLSLEGGIFRGETDGSSFHSLLCTTGDAVLDCAGQELPVRKGDSVFLPCGCGGYALAGRAELLITTV